MYLQSLELLGFKSFASKTVIAFDRGVTAVVGPNGCGKSNVLDAMRWVLGEQSAKALRGGEMADVIFSGTDSRPALGMAEVSLTFTECENELGVEWNEVRITRRIFRDGNSEYLLNKTPCRLRDIQQLFMDTGIGRSAYSIMEQGKIDLVLSARAEDRRAIFEEAAGITKYKTQKKEALRKLEYTEANLLRLGDIIKEVKRQIGSLQRQAGKARRYQALMNDLRTLDTNASRVQFDALQDGLRATEQEISALQETRVQHEQEIESKESRLTETRHELDALEQTISNSHQAVHTLRSHIGNAESRIALNGERAAEIQQMIERYEEDVATAEEKLRAQESAIHQADLELDSILQTLALEQKRLEEKTQQANAASTQRVEMESELQTVFGSITDLDSRISTQRNNIATAVSQRAASELRLQVLQEELHNLSHTSERVIAQLGEITTRLEANSKMLRAGDEQFSSVQAGAQNAQGELARTEQQLGVEHRHLAEIESRLNVLRQLNEEGEGFAEGTQNVLRGLDNPEFFKPAILGALAAHIEVEPEFIAAIEAALGGNLQMVLIKDASVAESALKTLMSQTLGRAALAALDLTPAEPLDNETLPSQAIAWAVEKVKMPAELRPLVSRLLHGVALVPDLEAALELRNAHPNVRFVTLAGEVICHDGIMHGGRNPENSSSILQRKVQVAQNETQAASLRERISELDDQKSAAGKRLSTQQTRLQELKAKIQEGELIASTLRGQKSLLERDAEEVARRTTLLRSEQENLQSRQEASGSAIEALQQELQQLELQLNECHSRRAELEITQAELRETEAELIRELNELRIKVATEKQRHDNLKNQRQPMASRLQELSDLIEHRRRDIAGYHEKSTKLSAECDRIRTEIEATKSKAIEAEMRVETLISERGGIAQRIETLEADLRILRRQLTELHEQRSRLDVKQTQTQLRIENLCDHVMRRYQVDLRQFQPDTYALLCTLRDQSKQRKAAETENLTESAAEPLSDTDQQIDWQMVEGVVKEIEQRIDAMGPVNVEAIQEYDELEERHTFLEKQLEDLNKSKAELLDVIAKINVTTRKLFAETFEQVRRNFQEMFTELFGGGKANLILLDENDPLECGIDIIAKPPGKQLQTISLLSGGEKTMTAVALLFAIYMVKPSPFCVLDEMDAPLDESNINRFIKILNRFVSQSQFVVITHNKRTIARADVLYGVTMEEQGVSKLVGVRFSRREDSTAGTDIIGTANPPAIPSIAESFGKSDELRSERVHVG
jgi:chromosome segregation protein